MDGFQLKLNWRRGIGLFVSKFWNNLSTLPPAPCKSINYIPFHFRSQIHKYAIFILCPRELLFLTRKIKLKMSQTFWPISPRSAAHRNRPWSYWNRQTESQLIFLYAYDKIKIFTRFWCKMKFLLPNIGTSSSPHRFLIMLAAVSIRTWILLCWNLAWKFEILLWLSFFSLDKNFCAFLKICHPLPNWGKGRG